MTMASKVSLFSRTTDRPSLGKHVTAANSAGKSRVDRNRNGSGSKARSRQVVRSGSTSGRGPQPVKQTCNGDINGDDSSPEENDVMFINVPSDREKAEESEKQKIKDASAAQPVKEISIQAIMDHAQENDFNCIYDIDVHATAIGKISNLEKFTKLRVLDMSSNDIRKIENIDENKDLRDIKLYDNKIEVLENLSKLRELCHLQLQHNRIKDIGKGLINLRKLKILRVDSNYLMKVEARDLAGCSQLTSLDISNNRIDNLAALNSLPNLEELCAVGNRLRVVTDLARCKKLQEVDISSNRITDLSGLKGLTKLTTLNVSHNYLSSLKSLGKIRSLQELTASHNRLAELQHIAEQFHSLEMLEVSFNNLKTWEAVCPVKHLTCLMELYIQGNSIGSENGTKLNYYTEVQHLLPHLEILDGAYLKRPSRTGTPLMRPMSATSVVSAKQVENHLGILTEQLATFETKFTEKFDLLRSTFDSLPQESPRVASARSEGSLSALSNRSDRPASRCSSRSRLKEAKEFAEQHF